MDDLAHTGSKTGGMTDGQSHEKALAAARRCLAERVAGLTGDPPERRHESMMEWTAADLGLAREFAEDVYRMAEEESLEPVYAFQLMACGLGVRELEQPDPDMEETHQEAPPDWVQDEVVALADVALERRLRTTFRRFRHHLNENPDDPSAAVTAFVAEPDVDLVTLR